MEVIFTEFWPFVAACLLVSAIFNGIARCIHAWRGTKCDGEEE